jgi:hypothetical protein
VRHQHWLVVIHRTLRKCVGLLDRNAVHGFAARFPAQHLQNQTDWMSTLCLDESFVLGDRRWSWRRNCPQREVAIDPLAFGQIDAEAHADMNGPYGPKERTNMEP